MGETKNTTFRFNQRTLEQLDEVIKIKYRAVDRSQGIRWMIEDAYIRVKDEQEERHKGGVE